MCHSHEGRQARTYSPVEEDERALPEDDEGRVDELKELGEDEGLDPEADGGVAIERLGGAARHGGGALGGEQIGEVGHDAEGADDGEEGEEEVPVGEGPLEVEGLAARHDLLPAEDAHDVEHDGGGLVDSWRDGGMDGWFGVGGCQAVGQPEGVGGDAMMRSALGGRDDGGPIHPSIQPWMDWIGLVD